MDVSTESSHSRCTGHGRTRESRLFGRSLSGQLFSSSRYSPSTDTCSIQPTPSAIIGRSMQVTMTRTCTRSITVKVRCLTTVALERLVWQYRMQKIERISAAPIAKGRRSRKNEMVRISVKFSSVKKTMPGSSTIQTFFGSFYTLTETVVHGTSFRNLQTLLRSADAASMRRTSVPS